MQHQPGTGRNNYRIETISPLIENRVRSQSLGKWCLEAIDTLITLFILVRQAEIVLLALRHLPRAKDSTMAILAPSLLIKR